MSVPALSRSLSDYFKPDWPYADDDWIVISSHNPKAVHRLGKWPSGVVDVACGSLAMTHAVRFRGTGAHRLVIRKRDHETGDWREVFTLPKCRKCWPDA